MKEKVLINASTFPRWENDEVPSFILDFAKSLTEDYEVHVLTPHFKGAKRSEVISGIYVRRFIYAPFALENLSNGKSILENIRRNKLNLLLVPLYFFSNMVYFIYLNSKFRYRLVNIHWIIPSGLFGIILKPFFKYKLVITSHGSDIFGFKKSLLSEGIKFLTKLIIRYCDTLIVVSSALRNEVNKLYSPSAYKVKVISMGIDFKLFNTVSKSKQIVDTPVLLFVGRLAEEKGVEYLIRACNILEKKMKFECWIVGEGPYRRFYEGLARELGLTKEVTFKGFKQHEELVEIMKKADYFIGPSITSKGGAKEGFGLVFLESMAAGLPVIATNVGGIPDIVKNEETGLLIQEKNPEQIAKAVERLKKDEKLKEKLIKQGIDLASGYDWPIIAKRYKEVFNS